MGKDMVSHLNAFLNNSIIDDRDFGFGAYEEGIMIGVHDSGRFPKVLEYPFPIERFWRELDAIMEEVQDA